MRSLAFVDRARHYLEKIDSAPRWLATSTVMCAVAIAAVQNMTWPDALVFSPDDAYITLHNAISLKAGHDDVFIGVSPLYGATSLFHLVEEALLLFVLSPLRAVWVAAWIGVAALAAGVVRLAYAMRLGGLRAIALSVATLTAGLAPLQLLNGLETGTAMAVVAWCLAFAIEVGAKRWYLPVGCALAPLLRPELVAFSGLLLALSVWQAHTRAGVGAAKRRIAEITMFFAMTLAPWLLFSLIVSGHLLPSTVSAKRDFFCDACAPFPMRSAWFQNGIVTFGAAIGFLSVGYLGLARSVLGRCAAVFIFVFLSAYWLEFPGAVAHYECRYLYVLLPIAIYGVAVLLQGPARWSRITGYAVLVLALAQSLWLLPDRVAYVHGARGYTSTELMPVAEWAEANIPHDARVLVHDAGYISYGTNLHLYDMVGLKSPRSAELHKTITWPSCGADRARVFQTFALEVHATHLIASRGWGPIYKFDQALRDAGWRLDRIRAARDGGTGYDVYALTPPP